MIVCARVVVTMDGAPIENGAVRIAGNRIAEVGDFAGIASAGEEVIDLGDSVLLPGLINAHCHLDYTCLRGKIPPQESFADWIRAINAEKAKLTADDYLQSIVEGFAEAQRFGTTAMVNLAAFPELIAKCDERSMRTWWCAELIDVATPEKSEDLLSSALKNLEELAGNEQIGLAPHALFTASPKLFQRCQQIAEAKNFLLTTHLAESSEEMEMFRSRSGKLFDFLQSLERPMDDCDGRTPLELFSRTLCEAASPKQWIIAHLNELTANDFMFLEKMPTKFSIAHCPRSHAYFGHSRFEFEKLDQLGFNICLATDSLASNRNLSLLSEARQFRKIYPKVKPERILKMITLNPGRALGAKIGEIRPGFLADLIALPWTKSKDASATIVAFEKPITWIMVDGQIVARNSVTFG